MSNESTVTTDPQSLVDPNIVFADPVTYLGSLGIEAELISTHDPLFDSPTLAAA